MFRRLFALTGLLIALAGTGVFVAIAVQVWRVKAEVNRQTAELAGRANQAGDAAGRAVNFVGDVIDRARAELTTTRISTSAPEPVRVNPFVRMTARQASIDLAGSLERALGAVVTASDTVIVAETALDMVSADPRLSQAFGVNTDQIHQTRTALTSVAGELRQAKSILGVPVRTDSELPSAEQLDAVDRALQMAEQFKAEMARLVGVARVRVNETRQLIDVWALRLAVAVTALSVLGAVGQLFMARFCLRKLHELPA
ncbi:hypothetical protein [Gemmata sp.]|uniref:hypothetical protein n=1 Tax=Gemmata sp. TaxID=1914242 RepID=UPI003F6FA677